MSSSQESPEESPDSVEFNQQRKLLLVLGWSLAEWALVGPLLHVRSGQSNFILLLGLSFLLLLGVVGGLRALLVPEIPPIWPLPVALGGVSSLLLLSTAPASVHLSLMEMEAEPKWLVAACVGTVAAIAYLVLMVVWWRSRAMPPNKSLERTREG